MLLRRFDAHGRIWVLMVYLLVTLLLITTVIIGFGRVIKTVTSDSGYGFASPEFAKAHLFHGIQYSQYKDGKWVFMRDGKECKVFGGDYEK
jgi:hypothetical protein